MIQEIWRNSDNFVKTTEILAVLGIAGATSQQLFQFFFMQPHGGASKQEQVSMATFFSTDAVQTWSFKVMLAMLKSKS